ncbi:hypothetical protein AB0H77_23065 [Streptomyces sp. NPDC050844]
MAAITMPAADRRVRVRARRVLRAVGVDVVAAMVLPRVVTGVVS